MAELGREKLVNRFVHILSARAVSHSWRQVVGTRQKFRREVDKGVTVDLGVTCMEPVAKAMCG